MKNQALTCEAPAFWAGRYDSGETPWDLGQPAPPFTTLLENPSIALPPGRMAVLGCGRGHDAALFARHGFEVLGLDYTAQAVSQATQRYGDVAKFVQADIFDLPAAWSGTFDYALEHTCFCAIPLARRDEYVAAVHHLLKPGGQLIALFWCHQEAGGPPFKTDRAELDARFLPRFEWVASTVPENSVPDRQGQELLAVLRKV